MQLNRRETKLLCNFGVFNSQGLVNLKGERINLFVIPTSYRIQNRRLISATLAPEIKYQQHYLAAQIPYQPSRQVYSVKTPIYKATIIYHTTHAKLSGFKVKKCNFSRKTTQAFKENLKQKTNHFFSHYSFFTDVSA